MSEPGTIPLETAIVALIKSMRRDQTPVDMGHLNYLEVVVARDVLEVRYKENSYRGSWKKRGGPGAFLVGARKWDRLEEIVKASSRPYDIFYNPGDGSDGTLIAEIRDLRRYLLLWEAELWRRQALPPAPVPLTEENHHGERA